ncbi:DUF2163 domain-containing protein [Rhizobium sp. L1K21]|uniref:DUF2163 domain-containing protein n=1 Tax=Rhizobium sp. L1K21 TaxID=2954933 RepID=UPI002092E928|nr:DUF2163 domain-containing protein [Rhizobium sp. L1K21]MCO6186683.1 DUF2163 domain-containing protein [Rhizobium sp. L1K21]
MRKIPAALKAHLDGGVTTTCRAWRVTRRDGTVLGFTEHDGDLTFDETTFFAASGFQASDAEAATGMAAANGEVAGAFSSQAISEEDLMLGLYDGAKVEVFVVNWAEPSQYVLEAVREIGEVTRTADHFQAELRGIAARLDQPQGRVYARGCDTELGSPQCGIDLAQERFSRTGAIVSASATQATVSGLEAFDDGFLRFGVLTFTSGALAATKVDIGAHTKGADSVTLGFWLPLPKAPQAGDTFSVVAGCDKRFATCKAKFANAANFRGFPHMPGSDFAYSYASGASAHDGSPLFG